MYMMDSGVQRFGESRGQQLDCMPPPKLSSTQECDKDRHLKYVKASVEKTILKNLTKIFQRVYFVLMCKLKAKAYIFKNISSGEEYALRKETLRLCMQIIIK